VFRVKLAAVVLGGVLAFMGFEEYRVSSGATSEPESIDLSGLEAGQDVANTHIRIGLHSAVYAGVVYRWEGDEYSNDGSSPNARVKYAYYPIISRTHPFNVRWDALAEKYGSYDDVPETEDFPELTTFSVLVKTERFKTVGTLPEGILDETERSGLLIHRIDGLDEEEKILVREGFPQVDFDKLLILEDGRKPSSAFMWMGMMAGGLLVSLTGVALLVARRQEG